MSVIPFTLFVSLLLTGLFITLFARGHRLRSFGSAESESLLPLSEEKPRPASAADEPDHDHDHDHDHNDAASCGCRSGKRAPCPGCLKRPATESRASLPR